MAKEVSQIISHWNHSIDGLNQSSLETYQQLDEAIERRQLPKAKRSRVNHLEGNIFSATREYLRVQHRDHIFDLCAAPCGTGFFFSWWLEIVDSLTTAKGIRALSELERKPIMNHLERLWDSPDPKERVGHSTSTFRLSLSAWPRRRASRRSSRRLFRAAGASTSASERDGTLIACEISETTSDAHELKNIQKCFAAGYEKVILCSQERKFLEKVQAAAGKELKESEAERVFFLQPEALYFLLEEATAGLAGKEERVKG